MSTVLSLPDEQRTTVERELVALARQAALGEAAAGVAHDIANPLFSVLGLVELLLGDAEPGSEAAERLVLIRQTGLELKESLRGLLEFARPANGEPEQARLDDAARAAVALLRHGAGRTREIAARYPDEPVLVRCGASALRQAALHVAAAAAAAGGGLELTVAREGETATLRVSPTAPETLGLVAARRIVEDCGGSLERGAEALTLRLPAA